MNGYMLSPIGIIVIALYSGLIILVFLAIGYLLALLATWLFGNSVARWVRWVRPVLLVPTALVLLSLPWLEEAYISEHFNEACQDAGVKVYQQVEAEGFYNETGGIYSFIKDYGFKFMEEKTSEGKILHVESPIDMETPMDQWQTTIIEHPTARYHLIHAYLKDKYQIEEPIGWKLQKIERRIIDSQTGEVLGRDTTIIRFAPFHEALIAGLFGSTIVMCPSPNVKSYVPQPPFITSILKPIPNK